VLGSHYPLACSAIGSCSVAVGPGNLWRMVHALATVETAAAMLALAGTEATAAPPVSGPEHVAWASSHVVDGSDPRSHLWVVRADGTGLRRVL
jgi:hypothetical protein